MSSEYVYVVWSYSLDVACILPNIFSEKMCNIELPAEAILSRLFKYVGKPTGGEMTASDPARKPPAFRKRTWTIALLFHGGTCNYYRRKRNRGRQCINMDHGLYGSTSCCKSD